ncbi:hypothetical protein ABPG74_016493 [Tetrahymena malaccensis]
MSLDEEGTSDHYQQKTFLLNQSDQDINRLKHLHERLEESCLSEQQNQSRIEDISTFPINQAHKKKNQNDIQYQCQTELSSNNQNMVYNKNKQGINKSLSQSYIQSRNKLEELEIISRSPTQRVTNQQFNIIGIILTQMDEEEDNKRRDINIINDFMRRRNISKNLQRRVNLDLEYYYKKNFKKKQIENQLVLSKISQHLNEQILREYYGITISKISFLSQNFSVQTINELCLTMEEVQYLPNQIIYDENDHDDFSLIYIQSGEVELIQLNTKDNNHQIDTIKQDSILGQENFFTGTLRSCRVRSKTFTSVVKISRNKFIEIIKNNEIDYEKFMFIKDQIFLYQNYHSIKISCYICNKFSHFTRDCPLVHFDKNESYNKMGYLQKVKQQRSPFDRNKQKTQNALLIINNINYATQQLISNPIYDIFEKQNEVNEISIESQCCEEEQSEELSQESQEIQKSDENILSKDLSPTVNKNQALFKQYDEKELVQDEQDQQIVQNKDSLQQNQFIFPPFELRKSQSKENQLKPLQIQQSASEELNLDTKQKKQNEKSQTSYGSLKNISKLDMFQQQSQLEPVSSPLAMQPSSKRATSRIQKRNSTYFAENRRNAVRLQTVMQFKSILDIEDNNHRFKKDQILWNFDIQKDYQIYFPEVEDNQIIQQFKQLIIMDFEFQDIQPFKNKLFEQEDQDQQNLRQLFDRKEESCNLDQSLLSSNSRNFAQSIEQTNDQHQFQQTSFVNNEDGHLYSNNQINVLKKSQIEIPQQNIYEIQNNLDDKEYAVDNKQSLQKIQDVSQNSSFQNHYIEKINSKELKNSSFDLSKRKFQMGSNRNMDAHPSSHRKNHTNLLKQNNEINFVLKIKNRLIEFYQNNTDLGRRSLLKNRNIRQSINDKSDFLEEQIQNKIKISINRFISLLKKFKTKVIQSIPLFNPQNPLIFALQIIFCLINCFYFLFYSTILTFGVKELQSVQIIYFIITAWILEVIVKINTAIYINTDLVKDRSVILGIYFKQSLLYDIIPIISLLNRFDNYALQIILTIATFIKLKNVINELLEIQKQLCMEIKNYFYVQIFNLVAKIFISGHLIGLIYFLVGYIELYYLGEPHSWFEANDMENSSFWWKTYLTALYWSLTLMATGSNIATTTFQTLFTSLIMLLTTIFFGYFVSMIGIILEERDEQELAQRKDINIINEFMRKRNISKNLQRRVNLDLEYFYLKNFKKNQQENEDVLGRISQTLNDQLQVEYFKEIIKKYSSLSNNFSEGSIEKLCLSMVEENYIPNQIIFQENDTENLGILIILEGSIEMTKRVSQSQDVSKTLSILGKGQSTGLMSFFTGQLRTATARSKSFTTIIRIQRDEFIKIIKENETDFQQFNFIKDKIQIYGNYEDIRIQCSLCKKFTHYTSDCPLVHFNKQQYQNKLNYFEKIQQKRQFMQRKSYYYHSRVMIQKLKECSEQFEFLQRMKSSQNQDQNSDNSSSDASEKSIDKQIEQNTKFEELTQLEKQFTQTVEQKKQSSLSKIQIDLGNSQNNIQCECQDSEQTKVKASTVIFKQRSNQLFETNSSRNIKNFGAEEYGKRPTQTQFILKQRKVQDNLELEVQCVQSYSMYDNPWIYDKQKDFSIYFPDGNLKLSLCKNNLYNQDLMINDLDDNSITRFEAYKNDFLNLGIDFEQNKLKNLHFRKEESFQSEKSSKIFLDEVVEQINQPNQNLSMMGEVSNAISCSKNNLFQNDKEQNSLDQQEIQVDMSDLKSEIKSNLKKDFLERSSNPNILTTFGQKLQLNNQQQNSKIIQQETWMSNHKAYCSNNINTNQTKYQMTISGRTNYLKISKLRNILNDLSDLRDQKRSRFINNLEIFMIKLQKKKKKCFKMIPLFNSQTPLLFSYQIIYNILNICFFILLSVMLVFQGQFEYQQTILKIIAFIWAFNVLVKLNTSIYIGTDIAVDREKIMANYIKNNALNDLISFVSILFIQSSDSINFYLAIITFIKIRNIKEENDDIQRHLCIAVKKYFGIQLINLVFKLFMIAHIIACMWQLVLVIERNYLNVNIDSTSSIILDSRNWWIEYLESLYWSLTLMATGSNLANTPLSVSFTCINMLITTIIFGYLINVIGVMLSAIDEQEQMQRRDINIINDYMRKRCISKNLQRRVNIDLEYFYQKNYKKISEENEQVLAKISTHLNEQIHREYYGRILNKIQYISKYFSEQTLNKILDCIEELYYLPNQIIFREDQNSDFSLMYIAEGSVELSRQVSAESQISKTLAVLGQECIFGQHSFFTGHVRGACAKSKAFTTIIKISRDKFLNIIQQNEKDYEQFCQIKDDIMIYRNYEKIQIKCFICNQFNHYSSDCPMAHFDREEFYSNMSFYQKIEQFRKYKERSKKKKINTLLILQQVKDASNQMVQIEFKEFIEEVGKLKDYPVTELDTDDENESEFQSKIKSKEEFVSKQRNSVLVQSMNELQDIQEAKKSQKFIQEAKSKLQACGKDEFCQNQERQENQRSSFNNILDSYQAQDMKVSAINKGSMKRIDQGEHNVYQSVDRWNINQRIFQDIKQDCLIYFDKAKEYQIYYPNGNYRILISKYNRAMKKFQKKKKLNKKN